MKGGAIYYISLNNASFRITDSDIRNNSADIAGAIYVFGVILDTNVKIDGIARLFGNTVVTYPEAMRIYIRR